MEATLNWLEFIFKSIPLPLLEVWGRFGFIIGIFLMLAAYGGLTFHPNGRWAIERERQPWDEKSFVAIIITFILIIVTGYIGSFTVLVPGAQTFESLKDLSVFVSIIIFGYPALLIVPLAYVISDIIEGVSPLSIVDWGLGYLINPAFFWMALQLFGKDPDFRKLKTWVYYLVFVLLFLSLEPQSWGYICSGVFTPEIGFRNITPSLFFTTLITWIMAPFAMLLLLPLAKKYNYFWADNRGKLKKTAKDFSGHFPIRLVIAIPFIVLMLIMVGTTAFITLKSGETNAHMLIDHLQSHVSENLKSQLNQIIPSTKTLKIPNEAKQKIKLILKKISLSDEGRIFIVDGSLNLLIPDNYQNDLAVKKAREILAENNITEPLDSKFEIVTAKPLARVNWYLHATAYGDWIIVMAYPETFYLGQVRRSTSFFAMAFAILLVLSLVLIAYLIKLATAPLDIMIRATEQIANGNLDIKIPGSRLKELENLATSFNFMAEKLKISNRLKSEFLDVAAHELRTPITPVILLVQLALKQINEGKPIPIEVIKEIDFQIYRLNRLIDDLLDASLVERGDLQLKFETTDITKLIKQCITDFLKRNNQRQIEYIGTEQPLLINIDRLRIELVLVNLIDNAIKYTAIGSVITVKMESNKDWVQVAVIDRGEGISEEEKKNIFNKYYQSAGETHLVKSGMGLGLYISRIIIEQHGGTIICESELGKGTTFIFTLPSKGLIK